MDEIVKNDKGYIDDDIKGRPFFWFAVGFGVFTLVSLLAVYWMYGALTDYHEEAQLDAPTQLAADDRTPQEPRLQKDPVADMKAMDAEQMALLSSYGWVDEDKGIVRIPIDKAIELTLEQSLVKAQGSIAPAPVAEAAN